MKIKVVLVLLQILFISMNLSAQSKKIIQDNNGNYIEAWFDNNGIIEKIKGSVGNYTVDEINIVIDNGLIKISKNTSSDGCYDIEIENHNNYLSLTKIFTANKRFKPRDNLTYKIYFSDNNDYYIKDDYITIKKTDVKSIGREVSESFLPIIKWKDNVCIQYFGKTVETESPGSRKYEYSSDKKQIHCYRIMPGDIWEKYLDVIVEDLKSDNKAVNVINYLILYNYNNQLGVMLFPNLFCF